MKNETKITKILYNQVSFLFAVCSLVICITLFITNADNRFEQNIALIQQDLKYIKENHLVHIEKEINENQRFAEENRAMIYEIKIKVEKILAILERK